MATNFISPGKTLSFTAPGGGVTSGTCVKIGDILVLALETVAAGSAFQGLRLGVISHVKVSAQAWTEGQQINWDDTAKKFTTVTTGNFKAGVAAAVAANPSATGQVVLAGVNLGAALA